MNINLMQHNNQKGYVGLLLLIISVTIMVFMIFKEYEQYGIIKPDSTTGSTTVIVGPGGGGNQYNTALDRAQNIKNVLETRDQGILNQEDSTR